MITDTPAPPDLAELIAEYRVAVGSNNARAESRAYIRLINWRGYRKGITYHYADVRVFRALGSIKVGPWPRA